LKNERSEIDPQETNQEKESGQTADDATSVDPLPPPEISPNDSKEDINSKATEEPAKQPETKMQK